MNTLEAIVALVKAQPAVAALVGVKVYGRRAPGGKALFPCVTVNRVASRGSDPDLPYESLMVDVRCYGATQDAAEQVYRALEPMSGMNHVDVGAYRFLRLQCVAGPNDMDDSPNDSEVWDCVLSSWEFDIQNR